MNHVLTIEVFGIITAPLFHNNFAVTALEQREEKRDLDLVPLARAGRAPVARHAGGEERLQIDACWPAPVLNSSSSHLITGVLIDTESKS